MKTGVLNSLEEHCIMGVAAVSSFVKLFPPQPLGACHVYGQPGLYRKISDNRVMV